MMRSKILLAAALALLAAQSTADQPRPRIAIIIDDLGYHWSAGQRAVSLPGPVACAILPGTPRGRELAGAAHENGKEVLLHLPMQSMEHDGAVEASSITLDMSRTRFAHAFEEALQSVPHAVGVNTHRGSLVTRHPGHMQWLMDEIGTREPMFFVDSYTTHLSVALQIANESGIPAAKRDVFLDPDRSQQTVVREFERLKKMARERGVAVGIGHPYENTLELLERELPRLAEQGFELVPVSAVATRP